MLEKKLYQFFFGAFLLTLLYIIRKQNNHAAARTKNMLEKQNYHGLTGTVYKQCSVRFKSSLADTSSVNFTLIVLGRDTLYGSVYCVIIMKDK